MTHPEPYTHEQWHKHNKITANECGDCKKYGRIITTTEWLSIADQETAARNLERIARKNSGLTGARQ